MSMSGLLTYKMSKYFIRGGKQFHDDATCLVSRANKKNEYSSHPADSPYIIRKYFGNTLMIQISIEQDEEKLNKGHGQNHILIH